MCLNIHKLIFIINKLNTLKINNHAIYCHRIKIELSLKR